MIEIFKGKIAKVTLLFIAAGLFSCLFAKFHILVWLPIILIAAHIGLRYGFPLSLGCVLMSVLITGIISAHSLEYSCGVYCIGPMKMGLQLGIPASLFALIYKLAPSYGKTYGWMLISYCLYVLGFSYLVEFYLGSADLLSFKDIALLDSWSHLLWGDRVRQWPLFGLMVGLAFWINLSLGYVALRLNSIARTSWSLSWQQIGILALILALSFGIKGSGFEVLTGLMLSALAWNGYILSSQKMGSLFGVVAVISLMVFPVELTFALALMAIVFCDYKRKNLNINSNRGV